MTIRESVPQGYRNWSGLGRAMTQEEKLAEHISNKEIDAIRREKYRAAREKSPVAVSSHCIDRFQQRFDSKVTRKEAAELLELAYAESVPCPKRFRPHVKLQRYCKFLYHKEAGLVILVRPAKITRDKPILMTCWVINQNTGRIAQ